MAAELRATKSKGYERCQQILWVDVGFTVDRGVESGTLQIPALERNAIEVSHILQLV